MLESVCVSGGSSLVPGFVQRLTGGMQARASGGVRVRAHAPENRELLPWIGACCGGAWGCVPYV